MSNPQINDTLNQLVQLKSPDVQQLSAVFSTSFNESNVNPFWTFYRANINPPFAIADLRLAKEEKKVLLNLDFPADSAITRGSLDFTPWGTLHSLDPNPGIPPEGADTYIYRVNGVRLAFQFTHTTERLLLIALEWSGHVTD